MLRNKLVITSIVLLLTLAKVGFVCAQSSDQIARLFVQKVSVDQSSYKAGDTVKGTFSLSNQDSINASDIYYRVRFTGQYDSDGIAHVIYDEGSMVGPIFVKSNSVVNENFTYTLPDVAASGKSGIEIQALTKGGRLLSWVDSQFAFLGSAPTISVTGVSLKVGDKFIVPTAGPTIDLDQTAALVVDMTSQSKESVTLLPNIKIYNRVVSGAPLFSTSSPSVTIPKNGKTSVSYSLPLFNNAPGVYAGTINFLDSKGVTQSPTFDFRYIIPGDIVTIQSVSIDTSSAVNERSARVTVSYSGAPFDIITSKTPDLGEGDLTLSLFDQDNTLVGASSTVVSLNGVLQKSIKLAFNANTQSLRAEAVITKNGKTLATFDSQPNLVEFSQNLSKNNFSNAKKLAIAVLVLLILIALILWFKRKKVRSTIALLICLSFVTAIAFGVRVSSVQAAIVGGVNGVSASGVVTGWEVDTDNPSSPAYVETYYETREIINNLQANLPSPDVAAAHPTYTGNHRFSYQLPSFFFDGLQHHLYVFGDKTDKTNPTSLPDSGLGVVSGQINQSNPTLLPNTSPFTGVFTLASSGLSDCARHVAGACLGGWTFNSITNSQGRTDPNGITVNIQSNGSSGSTVVAGQPFTVSVNSTVEACLNATDDVSATSAFNGNNFTSPSQSNPITVVCGYGNVHCHQLVSNIINDGTYTAPTTPGQYTLNFSIVNSWTSVGTVETVNGTMTINVVLPPSSCSQDSTSGKIFRIDCTSSGQLCSPTYDVQFNNNYATTSLSMIYSVGVASPVQHCSSVKVHVLVDGVEKVATPWMGWLNAPSPWNSYPLTSTVVIPSVTPGNHVISLKGEGQTSGCNNANKLASWGGSVSLTCSPITIPASSNLSYTCSSDGTVASTTWTLPTEYTDSYFRAYDQANGDTFHRTGVNTYAGTFGYNNGINGETTIQGSIGNSYSLSVIPGHTYTWWVHTKATYGPPIVGVVDWGDAIFGTLSCSAPTSYLCSGTGIVPDNKTACPGTNILPSSPTNWSAAGPLLTNCRTDSTNVCKYYSTPTPTNGSCSSPATHYNCATGSSINNVNGASSYTWSCAGSDGGSTAVCSETKAPPPVGTCYPTDSTGATITSANIGQQVIWTASDTSKSHTWTGENIPASASGVSYSIRYSTVGNKTARMDNTVDCKVGSSQTFLPIKNSPNFHEI